jgi:hypothetical protein
MKRIFAIVGAALFVLGFGMAYAGSALNNGVTDFTGKTYDVLEMAAFADAGNSIQEGAAAGGIRLVGSETEQIHNGITDFSGRTYDTLEINREAAVSNEAEGSAAGGPRRNFGDEEYSVRTYDSVPMGW